MLIHFIPAFETKWVQHNFETKFKRLCSQCAKYLIPKEVYYKTIDNLKTADAVSTHKSRHQYYILKCMRYFSLVMWRSLSRREVTRRLPSLLCHHRRYLQHHQQSSHCNWPRWSWQDAETSWATWVTIITKCSIS